MSNFWIVALFTLGNRRTRDHGYGGQRKKLRVMAGIRQHPAQVNVSLFDAVPCLISFQWTRGKMALLPRLLRHLNLAPLKWYHRCAIFSSADPLSQLVASDQRIRRKLRAA